MEDFDALKEPQRIDQFEGVSCIYCPPSSVQRGSERKIRMQFVRRVIASKLLHQKSKAT